MASHRIEIAEVVSFRLKLPQCALGKLVDAVAPELPVQLASAGEDLFLRTTGGNCFLRFRPSGEDAILTQLSVAQDDRGDFFHRVVGPLLREHLGDLHVRLVWNDSDRNMQADFAEVIVHRGNTTYPEFPALPANQVPPGANHEPLFPLPEDDVGIQKLLAQAHEQWQEYLRLKAARVES